VVGAEQMPGQLELNYKYDEMVELKKALADAEYMYHEGDDEFELIDTVGGDTGRWYEYMTSYFKGPSGQHYAADWNSGLTEYQENTYDSPNVRKVKPVTKQVTITEWVRDE
jgi:hypothetical protein